MKRNRYRELYELRSMIDPLTGKERTQALYQGEYYRLDMGAGEKHRLGIHLALLVLAAGLLFLGAGLMDSPGSRCFYVLPFFLLMMFPLFYACMAVFRFARLPQSFTVPQKELCLDSLARSAMGLMVLAPLYTLGDILFLALGKAGDHLGLELYALLCVLGIGALAALLRQKALSAKAVPVPREG